MLAMGGAADIAGGLDPARPPTLTLIVALLRDFGAVRQMPSVVIQAPIRHYMR